MIFYPGDARSVRPHLFYSRKRIIFAAIKYSFTMTEEQKNALRENLLNRSVGELISIIIEQREEVEEAKSLRRRFMQIRNLILEPEERRRQGRPRKD